MTLGAFKFYKIILTHTVYKKLIKLAAAKNLSRRRDSPCHSTGRPVV